MKNFIQSNKKSNLLAESVMILGVLICLLSIATKSCIFFDEGFSINLIQNSFADILHYTALDVHPPLYYLVLKATALLFGNRFIAYYIPSFLCFAALIAITFRFFNRHFSSDTAFLISAGLCSLPSMLETALQIRMYSMAMLFVTAAFYTTYDLTENILSGKSYKWSKYWTRLTLFNILAAYTHYFAGVAAAAISCFVLLYLLCARTEKLPFKKIVLTWGIHCLSMIVLYLPWMPVLFKQMSNVNQDYWISAITEAELHGYPNILFTLTNDLYRDLLIVAYLIGFFLFLRQFCREHQSLWLAGCYVIILMWLGFGIGYSLLKSPILVSRYLVIILPLFWIPVCVCFQKEPLRKYSPFLLILFVLSFIDTYELSYDRYSNMSQEAMIAEMETVISEEDVLFYTNIKNLCVQKAYLPEATVYALEGCDKNEIFHYWPGMTGCTMIEQAEEMAHVTGNIWVFEEKYVSFFEEAGWKSEVFNGEHCTMYRMYR